MTAEIEKQAGASATLTFTPALPCTSQDCSNPATVGAALFDPRQNAWLLFPMCKSCTEALAKKYQGRQGECIECGRFSSQLSEQGVCEGCVMQAAIDAMEPQERWK